MIVLLVMPLVSLLIAAVSLLHLGSKMFGGRGMYAPAVRLLSMLLVTLAVRVLPGPDRGRYSEEFRVELADLPRGRRLGYGMRLVVRSVGLRRVLREEGEPSAEPVA